MSAAEAPADGAFAGGEPLSPETSALHLHLQYLSTMLWTDLDENGGRAWPDHFCLDGTFDFNARLTTGRDALRAHFEARLSRGRRVTAHLLSNLMTRIIDPRRAIVRANICVFGGDGAPPRPVALPSLVGTVEDHFERSDAGPWLVSLRRFRPYFHDPNDRVGKLVADA